MMVSLRLSDRERRESTDGTERSPNLMTAGAPLSAPPGQPWRAFHQATVARAASSSSVAAIS